MDSRTVSCYFIGYSERSKGYKFYDPTTKSIFETGNARFFEDVEFDGGDKDRDFAFEEEYVDIPIAVINIDQAPIPDIVQEQIQIKTIAKNLPFQKNKLYLLQNLRH